MQETSVFLPQELRVLPVAMSLDLNGCCCQHLRAEGSGSGGLAWCSHISHLHLRGKHRPLNPALLAGYTLAPCHIADFQWVRICQEPPKGSTPRFLCKCWVCIRWADISTSANANLSWNFPDASAISHQRVCSNIMWARQWCCWDHAAGTITITNTIKCRI